MNEFELMRDAIGRGEAVQTVTLIDGPREHLPRLGQMLFVYPDGRIAGELIDAGFTAAVVAKLQGTAWTKPCSLQLLYQQVEYRLFWNSVGADKFRAVILGGGHISQPLAQILSLLDYEVTIVDDRSEFANRQRFPWAGQVICADFSSALRELDLDAKTAVIIVTRGHRHDLECLSGVLGKNAGYVGMIGSSSKVRAIVGFLEADGAQQHLLQKVRAPIGLDIGAQNPAEIAVSIAAEVVAAFRGGRYTPLSRRSEASNG